jgi:uncharacterized protein YehS (DUF1456 family)
LTNNDIFRRLRYIFNYTDDQIVQLFAMADYLVTTVQVADWLKKEDVPGFTHLPDPIFATFLNGFINERRGKKEGLQPKPENELNNNIIFRKLKIALNLQVEDILDIYALVKAHISKPEVTALFRNPDQAQYRICQDQFLRYFLQGLTVKYRGIQ